MAKTEKTARSLVYLGHLATMFISVFTGIRSKKGRGRAPPKYARVERKNWLKVFLHQIRCDFSWESYLLVGFETVPGDYALQRSFTLNFRKQSKGAFEFGKQIINIVWVRTQWKKIRYLLS